MFYTTCYPRSMYDATAVCASHMNYEYLIFALLFTMGVIAVTIAIVLSAQYRTHRRMHENFIAEEYLPDGLHGIGFGQDSWEPQNPFLEVDDGSDDQLV